MQHLSLRKDSPSFSRLVYGVWRLGDDKDTSTAHVRAKIDACLAQGITSFDHADIYGGYGCEALFGQALAADASLRPQMQLISKCDIALVSDKYPKRRVKHYDTSPAYLNAQAEQSLTNLHTEYLDLLLIHRPDPFMDHRATGAALDALIDSGKVRAVGVSNFKRWDWELLQCGMKHPLVTNQLEISLLERDSFLDGTLAQLQRQDIRPMAWSPLGGGRLFGDEAAAQRLQPLMQRLADSNNCQLDHIAIAWLLAHPAGILPVIGTNNLKRVSQLSKSLDITLDRETWFELWTAASGEEVP